MRLIIANGKILTPKEQLLNQTLVIENGRIISIEADYHRHDGKEEIIVDARDLWVVPGFIDLHVHGSAGYDTMDSTAEALRTMSNFFTRHGVTSYLPTTVSAPASMILSAIENVVHFQHPGVSAQHLGVHIEGPYLNSKFKGAQPLEHLRNPDPNEYYEWFNSNHVRLITIAPELEGALECIERGVDNGIEFALGHTGATYEDVLKAADCGLQQSTHTYNGMAGLHHRVPGALGAVLTDDRIYAQIIVDGVHVHPCMVDMLIRCKGVDRTILITDAIRAAGLSDGEYELGGKKIIVQNGIVRNIEGSLAGSTLTLDLALRNVMDFTGLSLMDALPMTTSVPAEAIGLLGRKGELIPGADADVTLLDADLNVYMTIVRGQIAFKNQEKPHGGDNVFPSNAIS